MKKYVVILAATACMVMGTNAAERYGYNGTDNLPPKGQPHAEAQNVNQDIPQELNKQLSEMKKIADEVEKRLKDVRGEHMGGGHSLTNFGFNNGFPIGDIMDDLESVNNMISKLQKTITEYSLKK